MKFDCGETRQEKWSRLGKWHRWFAWHPVKVGIHDCRWFEYVERRVTVAHFTCDDFITREYRSV